MGKAANTDKPLWVEVFDDGPEVAVTGSVDGFHLGVGDFVGGAITAGLLHEDEGAVVGDEVIGEEISRVGEPLAEESPEPATADFRAGAGKAIDGTFGVFVFWFLDGSFDSHPRAHRFNFAEWHPGLGHSERAGVHPEHEDLFRGCAEAREVLGVGLPSVFERIVDVGDWRGEFERSQGSGQGSGRIEEGLCRWHFSNKERSWGGARGKSPEVFSVAGLPSMAEAEVTGPRG